MLVGYIGYSEVIVLRLVAFNMQTDVEVMTL
jgi:hypothetical protein